jgi:glycine/D-amino acid oxidase-like deaminating enzyme
MKQVDYIIIGNGISGAWLGYYLLNDNKSIIVIHDDNLQSASNVASGLINPVTGRRVVTTWLAEELMPFVWNEYDKAGEKLQIKIIAQKNILVFPSAPDLQQAFDARIKEQNSYIHAPSLQKEELLSYFNFPFGVFEISPCYVADTRAFLLATKQLLQNRNIFLEETFDETKLELKDDHVQYKNIIANKIVYANGIVAAQSKFWNNLPFVENKGQALIIEVDGLNISYVYKFGHLTLIHLNKKVWWVGSSNELSFNTVDPTEDFKNKTIASLKSILKKTCTVKEHWSALRPATVERRPFVGIHPHYKQIAILNGMGSKGCSLAPWFAKQLAENLINEKPIDALADVSRFSKMLMKKNKI